MAKAWPYWLPYLTLLLCAELASWLPASFEAPLLAIRVAGPALLLAVAWRRGSYPELGSGAGGAWRDVGFGLALAGLWMAPYLLVPDLPRGEPFDPDALGPDARGAWLALRLTGFVAVSPLVEELFVRSFLHRVVECWPDWGRYAERTVGQRHARAFVVTVAWFVASHAPWEWWVAAPTGVLLNLWLYRRGFRSVWLAHASTNAAVGLAVVLGPPGLWSFL